MDLPKNEKTFTFEAVGDITQKKYDGDFTVKCVLTMFDKREVELEKTRMCADTQNPTNMLNSISHILAALRIRILVAPSWWEQSAGGFEILDENIVISLYDDVMKQEDLWREELVEKTEVALGNPQTESTT